MVSGVVPRGWPSIDTAAPAGATRPADCRSPPAPAVARPLTAGAAGRGAAGAAAAAEATAEPQATARAAQRSAPRAAPRQCSRAARPRSCASQASRSRSASGVTPRATPSTSTLAPLGSRANQEAADVRRRPLAQAPGAGCLAGACGCRCRRVPAGAGATVPVPTAPRCPTCRLHLPHPLHPRTGASDASRRDPTAALAVAPCSRRRSRPPCRPGTATISMAPLNRSAGLGRRVGGAGLPRRHGLHRRRQPGFDRGATGLWRHAGSSGTNAGSPRRTPAPRRQTPVLGPRAISRRAPPSACPVRAARPRPAHRRLDRPRRRAAARE